MPPFDSYRTSFFARPQGSEVASEEELQVALEEARDEQKKRKEWEDEQKKRRAKEAATLEKDAVRDEEATLREWLGTQLMQAGLVGLLEDTSVCVRLDEFLRSKHGVRPGRSMAWFSSSNLSDLDHAAGGTLGLLTSEFEPVARCCGGSVLSGCEWPAEYRTEAVSYVTNRMADAGVWPNSIRGRKMTAVAVGVYE